MKEKKYRKVDYWFESDEKNFKQLAFSLFDMLGFKRNIVIVFFRIINPKDLYEFQNKVSCEVVHNVEYSDRYSVFIPELQSNSQLDRLMPNNYEFPTECAYIPLINDFDSFRLNQKCVEKNDAVSCEIAKFEALLDHEGIHLKFDLEYFELNNVGIILKNWEKTFGKIKYKNGKQTTC